MPLADDDRRALAARLATTAPTAVTPIADAFDDDEELREVLVDVDAQVVVLTARRALFVDAGEVRSFGYDAVDVRQRADGLGVDARVEGDRLVLDVARSTFVRLGVVATGNPPGRATWLPVRAPAPRPDPRPGSGPVPGPAPAMPVAGGPPLPPDASPPPGSAAPASSSMPPPGWHPDPSGRHWWRWWDGRGWTDHVADGGAPYVDPLPPR